MTKNESISWENRSYYFIMELNAVLWAELPVICDKYIASQGA